MPARIEKLNPALRGLLAVAVAVLAVASVAARTDSHCPYSGRSASRCPGSGWRHHAEPAVSPDPATGAVLIDLDDSADATDRAAVVAELRHAIAPFNWPSGVAGLGEMLSDEAELYRIRAPASEIADVLDELAVDRRVEVVEIERAWSVPDAVGFRAELDARAQDGGDRFSPNDPYYRYQWHLDQIGMPQAWTISRGAGVVVAVIDTGVSYRSAGRFGLAPDLASAHFVPGWDFVDGDDLPDDEHGHGTHVAGTIAQSTNNELGVAGVAPDAAIMPLRVLDARGAGGWGGIAAAIRWAADHGANVINMSLGGGMKSRTVERAIEYAHSKGVVVVAAAGNAARNRVEYPAMHNHVISVGAVRFDRTLSFYSSYGQGLDVVAPGGDLRVDQNGDGMPDGVLQNTLTRGRAGEPQQFDYLSFQGTSMAAPHVAGVAALIVSQGVTDPDAVERILVRSASDLRDHARYGAGLVQAPLALEAATNERGEARGLLATLGVMAMLLVMRRRRTLALPLERRFAWWAVLGVSLVVAGGLGAIPWHWIPGLGSLDLLSLGGPGLGAYLGGRWGAVLALSALVPLVAAVLLLHLRKLQPILVGLCLGTAAFLALEAVWPTYELAFLPKVLVGPWLVAQAAGALWLGHQVARRKPV